MNVPNSSNVLTFPAVQPLNMGLNVCIQTMALRSGYEHCDESEDLKDCPTTLKDITDYREENECFKIWTGDCEGTIYASAGINQMLRLWHDRVHYDYQTEFNVAGEAATVYAQIAEITLIYGCRSDVYDWAAILMTDIIGLVLYHRQSGGQWPSDKYRGTVENVHHWTPAATKLLDELYAQKPEDRVAYALNEAEDVWGTPY